MEIRRTVWVKHNLFTALYSLFPSKNPGWAIVPSLVLSACGIFQQEWEWEDTCKMAKQRQAGWERLRMNGTRVWNSGTRRDRAGKKTQGMMAVKTWQRISCTSAPNPWHGEHDSPVSKTGRKNWCGKLPTSLCHSPVPRRTTQQSCPSLQQLRGRHLHGGFKAFILSLSGWVTGLL